MSDYAEDVITEILREHVEPFPPAHHIAAVLMRELPKYGLTIIGTGAIKPKPKAP